MRRAPLFLLALLAPAGVLAEDKTLHLSVGDPARKGREAPVVLDAVTDTASGEVLVPGALAARLAGVRLLFVGESHTDADFHQVQLRVIEELVKAGREVSIGLEMYPYTQQRWLDAWVAGELTEEGFLRLSRWYESWGYHWNYYRDIFFFARDHRLPMHALNAPREVVAAVRKKGFKDLTEEEAAHIPTQIDTTSEEHRTLLRSYFDDGDPLHGTMTEEQWQGMIAAQSTWDATMAFHAVKALRAAPGPPRSPPGSAAGSAPRDPILVVLIGSGHVAYGLGVERQARQWLRPEEGRMASLIPQPIADADGEAVASVSASYANFLWGVPPETDPLYPGLGLSAVATEDGKAQKVVAVEGGGPAAAAGLAVGDVLVSIDGTPVPDRESRNRIVAGKRWGDAASVTVLRGGETKTFDLLLRRKAPAAAPDPR